MPILNYFCGVFRFPAQENVGGDSKIPTILYYDAKGTVRAVGAEANREGVEEDAEDQGWIRAEWSVIYFKRCSGFGRQRFLPLETLRFKLHMRPKSKATAHITDKIPPLPEGKNAMDLFADFLRYLHKCARSYIEETHANGPELWKSLEANIDYVLTHPNGWEGGQQNLMRRAAMTAGLITDDEKGRARLSFVTEGEASLHFCVQSGLTTEAIKVCRFFIAKSSCSLTDVLNREERVSSSLTPEEELSISALTSKLTVQVMKKLPLLNVPLFDVLRTRLVNIFRSSPGINYRHCSRRKVS